MQVRLQSKDGARGGPGAVIRKVIAEDGFLGLWRGTVPAAVRPAALYCMCGMSVSQQQPSNSQVGHINHSDLEAVGVQGFLNCPSIFTQQGTFLGWCKRLTMRSAAVMGFEANFVT